MKQEQLLLIRKGQSALNKNQSGQSLIELIVAIGIFTIMVLTLAFFVLNGYVSGRLSYEMTKANFLTQEAMEATRSIRDNNWDDLIDGIFALAVVNNTWQLTTDLQKADISEQLTGGQRTVTIESIAKDRKKIISKVSWKFNEGRAEEISLVDYLNNWQKISSEIRRPLVFVDPSPKRTTDPGLAFDENNGETFAATLYDTNKNPSIRFNVWQMPTMPYNSLTLNYRYEADQAYDDRYGVFYALNGCGSKSFIPLVPFTSNSAPDTTISVSIPKDQDLSKLCVKIVTERFDSRDGKNIYTRDIWTEGMP